jgi:hypothetical protein
MQQSPPGSRRSGASYGDSSEVASVAGGCVSRVQAQALAALGVTQLLLEHLVLRQPPRTAAFF